MSGIENICKYTWMFDHSIRLISCSDLHACHDIVMHAHVHDVRSTWSCMAVRMRECDQCVIDACCAQLSWRVCDLRCIAMHAFALTSGYPARFRSKHTYCTRAQFDTTSQGSISCGRLTVDLDRMDAGPRSKGGTAQRPFACIRMHIFTEE